MGKRKKRLTMARYAKKYATVRANIAKLKGEDAPSDELSETTNSMQLAENTPAQEEMAIEAVPVVSEEKASPIEEAPEEVSVEPVKVEEEVVEVAKPVEDIVEEIVAPKKTAAKKTTTTKKRSTSPRKKAGTRIASSRQKGKSAAAN